METVEQVIFYAMDRSIKTYRQFVQKRFSEEGYDITVDQWLVLNTISGHDGISQLEIAEKVFKDAASVTRIIDLLIKKGYLTRDAHTADRRRFTLDLTKEGKVLIRSIAKIAEQNRKAALKGIPEKNLVLVQETLQQITDNCK
jgi:DNA-binding MarR family transcriptional regulator